MEIHYAFPDFDNEQLGKILSLIYENYKLNIMWKLRHIEDLIDKETGFIYIDGKLDGYLTTELKARVEGFSEELTKKIDELLEDYKTYPLKRPDQLI